ncbi:hypothetical protein C3H41_08960 [Campylobacter jejuni]|uniref:hypothetical protein n=1 Tax=Campylobacter jejuni TaxID=197 RepID=UPI000F812241|nr:hypothetical protein [Campylobacter jejuni]RTK00925.1 hypothetical protein C3H41_08960 [Campylobacter jejuni]
MKFYKENGHYFSLKTKKRLYGGAELLCRASERGGLRAVIEKADKYDAIFGLSNNISAPVNKVKETLPA